MINNYLTRFRNCFGLAMLFTAATSVHSQTNYTVSSIPFQQYAAAVPLSATADDSFSAPITLPFPFTFFGNEQTQVYVSTNGYLKFSATNIAGNFSPWTLQSQIPSFNVEHNSIFGVYHDMNDSGGLGSITYGVAGTAPYRKFVIIFNNQAHFQCNSLYSSFQIILYETLNNIDVQIIDKPVCTTWNSGMALTGIQNADGTAAYTPPGRNTGAWTATHEGWRFSTGNPQYQYITCDADGNGLTSYNLAVVQNDLSPSNPDIISLYETATDAASGSNPLGAEYFNMYPDQTIFASGNGMITPIILSTIDCATDYDDDGVSTTSEDLNGDGNWANDDSDFDGIANFLDNDDDGDMVLTMQEYVFPRPANAQSPQIVDTDGDGIENYLDNDDDGDGVLTINEDYDGNHNPGDDDSNNNGVADYLDNTVALGVLQHNLANQVRIYPNPTSSVLYVDNQSGTTDSKISVFGISGNLVRTVRTAAQLEPVNVSDLESGIYFVRIELENQVLNYRFVKK